MAWTKRYKGRKKVATPAVIIQVRRMYSTGYYSLADIARKFGLSNMMIYFIVTGKVGREVIDNTDSMPIEDIHKI